MEQQETASIRFYTAGCMEFENYSECYENLTLAQAVDIYKKIRKRNACSIPGIGFELQDPAIPDYSGIHWPLLVADQIDKESIDMIPAYANHPLVQKAVKELEAICRRSRKGQSTGTLQNDNRFQDMRMGGEI